jgi:broad specificity phosphatase PhoE
LRLLLIRHAESQGNFEGRLQGRKEFPLTELGLSQASALAERLSETPVAAVYSSPIRRAFDTAAKVAERLGLEVTTEPRVQEYDFGDLLSGLTWPEIREKQPEIVDALVRNDSDFPRYPGEEGRKVFRDRVCAALAEIAENHRESEAVAVFAHAGPIAVYVLEALGRKYSRPVPFRIDNASITTVELAADPTPFQPAAVVTGINDTCHLRGLKGEG